MKYCENYAALLDPFVDGELSPDEMARVQAHLDECPACRAYVDDALAIRAAFPDAEDTPVPDGFAESVMARVRAEAASQAEAAPKKKTSRPWLKALASLAACCAIVLLAAPMFSHGSKMEAAPAEAPAAAAALTERAMGFALTEEAPAGESAGEAREDLASSKLYDAAPAPSAAADSGATAYCMEANTASWMTLTAEEAGSLLADFTPVEETETELRYELTSGELETLLAALSEAGIVPSGELHPAEMEDSYVLVIVTK